MQFNLITDLDDPPALDLAERGLPYGDGIFETMRLGESGIRYWTEHYQRLQRSAQRLGIPCPRQSWIAQQLQPYLNLAQELVLKLILTRGSGGRGLQLPEPPVPTIYLIRYPLNKDIKQTVKA